MSSVNSKFATAEIGVFWDIDGCPIPPGLTPASISANIKSALADVGYTGEISIFAYSVEKQTQEAEFESAQIELKHRETLKERDRSLYLDVMFWGIGHRRDPSNVLVISDDLSREPRANYAFGLPLLKENDNNILLVQPRNNPEGLALRDTVTSTWLWEILATGGSPLDGHSMEPVLTPSSVNRKFATAETGVFWDLDGCPIPAGLTPASISANIKSALEDMGYTGKISIVAYSHGVQSQEAEFESAQIELKHQETREEKNRVMYLEVMFWGIDHKRQPSNVMVISKDLIRDDVGFASGLALLKENENNVLVVHLYNPGGLPLRDTATATWVWKSLASGGSPLAGHCMRPEPTPARSVCSKRALRLANKRKKRPTNPFLKPFLKILTGSVNGKEKSGYHVTFKIGLWKLEGVLYGSTEERVTQDQEKQSYDVSPNTLTDEANPQELFEKANDQKEVVVGYAMPHKQWSPKQNTEANAPMQESEEQEGYSVATILRNKKGTQVATILRNKKGTQVATILI
ncbi:unnamed protein product [Microthlaspi erraticum]|uniref:NYN domain-containing protein n=1 Tax=Microthlaspi erraticum TaxID=1685480 RepID=A0A6D2IHP7_9BRAS|nr:unnamed protein product [Microthlaspi erraticum]